MVAKADIFDDSEFLEWFNNLPIAVQEVIKKYPPDREYKLFGPFPVTIHSYEENESDGITLKVDVHSPIRPRRVFGVKPESLKPFESIQNISKVK